MAEQSPSPMRSIRFRFDEKKATAAAALLLSLDGGSMEYMRLIKLMYLAERRSLELFGRPIFGGHYYSMKLGPVTSEVLNLIKADPEHPLHERRIWISHIVPSANYKVRVARDPGDDSLSEAEIAILKEAFELFRALNKWHLSELTHTLPEWTPLKSGRCEITPEEILQAVGKGDEEIEEIREHSIEHAMFDRIFGE